MGRAALEVHDLPKFASGCAHRGDAMLLIAVTLSCDAYLPVFSRGGNVAIAAVSLGEQHLEAEVIMVGNEFLRQVEVRRVEKRVDLRDVVKHFVYIIGGNERGHGHSVSPL